MTLDRRAPRAPERRDPAPVVGGRMSLAPLRRDDVAAAARLHRAAFPGFFLSSLGEEFLVEFYRGFLDDPTAVTLVASDQGGGLRGIVVGSTEPAGFYRRLLRRQLRGFVRASVQATVRRPHVARRLLHAVSYRGDTPADQPGALLSSICVDRNVRGSGVGGALLDGWAGEAARRGAWLAYLTTDATDNDGVRHFYERHGWTVDARFTTAQGRPMLRYRRDLDGA